VTKGRIERRERGRGQWGEGDFHFWTNLYREYTYFTYDIPIEFPINTSMEDYRYSIACTRWFSKN